MATLTARINVTGAGVNQEFTISQSTNALVLIDAESISNGQTDQEIAIMEVDQSAMNFLWIYSDNDITIETNSGSSPTSTIAVTGGEGILWYTGSPFTNPITGDITGSIFVTNSSGAAASLTMLVGQDPSP